MVQNCFISNIVRQSLLGTKFGFPEGLTFLRDLFDGKDRSNCKLDMQCLFSFDGFSPNDPKHEPSPHALYPAEKAVKARQIPLKLLVVPPCTGVRIIRIFLELAESINPLAQAIAIRRWFLPYLLKYFLKVRSSRLRTNN